MNTVTKKMYGKMGATSLFFMIFLLSLTITGCSTSRDDEYSGDFNYDKHGTHTFIFHEDGIEWKAKLKDSEITELYRDGEKIPVHKISKYDDFIHDKIDEVNEDMKEFHSSIKDFHFDMEKFNHEMADMRRSLAKQHFDFNNSDYNSFDNEEFKRDMEKASADIKAAFESDEFRENMKNLKEQLINIKVDVNMDKFNDEMRRLNDEMKNIKVDVNMDDFHSKMSKMKWDMKNMKYDFKDMKKGVRKFKLFLNDFREGLVEDGLLDENDEDFDMQFNSKELIINGKKAPAAIHDKYKKMYEERFDRKMDDQMSIVF